MASKTNTGKGNETIINADGEQETKVDTVDYRSSAGQNPHQTKENVQIIHQIHPGGDSGKSGDAGGSVLAGAAVAVSNTIQSTKDAFSGNNTRETSK